MNSISTFRGLILSALAVLCVACAMIVSRPVKSAGPKDLKSRMPIQMFDVGLGPHTVNLRPGRDTQNAYTGADNLAQAMRAGAADPRSMVADDFNGDGMSDLVVGYAAGNAGILSLRLGNTQAIAPTDPEVFKGVGEGRYPAPFLPQAALFELQEAPDFLQVGDFNADGYADVLAAANGGDKLYLLAGNGRGQLGVAQEIRVAGGITAMQADVEHRGRMTELALGLIGTDGAKISIYKESNASFAGTPESYSTSTQVTALSFGRLDDDYTTDLAAATGNQVVILHGRDTAAPAPLSADQFLDGADPSVLQNSSYNVELATYPIPIKGLAAGDFVFDRAQQKELALLAEDGTIYFSARGELDTRPYTKAEEDFIKKTYREYILGGETDNDTLTKQLNKLIRRSSKRAGWNVQQVVQTDVSLAYSGASAALFKTAPAPGLLTESLLVGNAGNSSVEIIKNEQDAQKLHPETAQKLAANDTFAVDTEPIAAVQVRLSINALPGMVVLNKGTIEPDAVIITPDATFVVATTSDTADPSPLNSTCDTPCSLRGAIESSNFLGGSNAITIGAGTYTLTVGPHDSEFNLNGATEESGDLDIENLAGIVGGAGTLTATTLNGADPTTTIIQMGTLTPTDGTGINKDRVLDIENPDAGTSAITTVLNNLTFRNGVAPCDPDVVNPPQCSQRPGGGIQVSRSPLTVSNCRILSNTASSTGGGLHNRFANLTINSGTQIGAPAAGNISQNAAGAGFFFNGGNTPSFNLIVDGSIVSSNTAQSSGFGSGGGFSGTGSMSMTVQNSTTVSNNISQLVSAAGADNGGGGIHFLNDGTITISNSTITGNTAKNNGGGIWSSARNITSNAASTIVLTTVTITNNQADSDSLGGVDAGNGGGIYNYFGTMTVNNSAAGGSITGNSANNGGGIYSTWDLNTADVPAGLTVTGSGAFGVINTNTAKNNGGGIGIDPNATSQAGTPTMAFSVTVNGVTLKGNTANSDNNGVGDGGAIYSNGRNSIGTVTLGNTTALTIGGTAVGEPNSAVNGGGIAHASGTLSSTNGTITGNNATGTGGGMSLTGGTVNTLNGIIIDSNTSAGIDGLKLNGATVTGAGTINFNNGDSIDLTSGTFTSTPGTLNLSGNFTRSGATFNHNNGLVVFNGSGAQALNGATTFFNLTINNSAASPSDAVDVDSDAAVTVANTLSITDGQFQPATGGVWKDVTIGVNGILKPDSGASESVSGNWNNGNGGVFTANSGTITFNASTAITQTVSGDNTFFNLTINNPTATIAFGATNTTVANTLSRTGGTTMDPGTGTFTFTGGAGSIAGASAKTFNNVVINVTATITNSTGGNLTVAKDFTNQGTFTQAAAISTTFDATNATHNFAGGGATTFGSVIINSSTAINANSHNFSVAGANFTVTGTFNGNTGTVIFNGSIAQTLGGAGGKNFNNLTINNGVGGSVITSGSSPTVAGLLRIQAGSFTTSSTFNNVQIDSGATLIGTVATTMNVSGDWTNNGTFTPSGNTVNFNGNNNTQTISGSPFNNITFSHTGTGTVQGTNGTTMSVTGNWTSNGTFITNGNTVNFNGAAVAQVISGSATTQTFDNFTVNKSGAPTLSVAASTTALDINGNVTLTLGTFAAGTATTITVAGNWTNNGGAFTAGTGMVTFDGGAGQAIGGTTATTFNNLTNGNASIGGLAMDNDNTVNGILALTSSNITVTDPRVLTQPNTASSSGTFDVVGIVKRTSFATLACPVAPCANTLSFGNPNNQITITAGTAPADITVKLAKSVPTAGNTGFATAGYPSAVSRTYVITPNGGSGISATLRLHYRDSDLNLNDANTMIFRRFNGSGWAPVTPTSRVVIAEPNNYLEKSGQTTFSPWTFSSSGIPTATSGTILGRITEPNGVAVPGAVINLSGMQNRKTITDANGNYHFDNVETTGFYTVRATRVNYSFSPQERSFSQLGNQTEAAFTATLSGTAINPLDTPEYFVRQHYLDFLGREPDEAGFNFWSDQILGCGGDAGCVEVKRINVSAAYFLSIEFQETGGLVDGLYRASFDRAPKYAEFLPDSATIGKDVIVGRTGWEQQLAANKQAFLDAFVGRPAFQSVYGGLSNDQYVDQLLTHTGINWTQAERAGLVNGLASGTLTRAGVLGQIAADQRFVAAKRNEAFVMMEYFGYLRRDPDAAGYQYWLDKLNQFNGNFEQAEMVKAFIVSLEYRERFPR